MYVVVVKDRAVDAFGRPFFVRSIGEAERSFVDEVKNKESVMFAHPEDYDLYQLGVFDDLTGVFNTHPPSLVKRAQDVRKEEGHV